MEKRLHVSLEIFKNCLSGYQLTVKAAKIRYISDLISNNSHNINVLFNTFDKVVNPRTTSYPDSTPELLFSKTETLYFCIPCTYHPINFSNLALDNVQLTHFNPTDLNKLKPTTSPVDIMPL